MPGLDNKISNIIGSKLPQWLLDQLTTRANQNSLDYRNTNDNILFVGNKSAWVRLVSSVDINSLPDLNYFKRTIGANLEVDKLFGFIIKPDSLAKQYILYGGTSKYLNKNSYELRSGLDYDGAYGMLGNQEVQKFGYKPMPGITSVNIETQGRLGSLRAATINFKCWDKNQLDIIDALYFKLGFTMFLEWGHTYFYPSTKEKRGEIELDPNKITSTELFAIDPFEQNLSKEQILFKVSQNSRWTEGNYDAMLGVCTNFNFTYTQDGGYDCTLRIMSLGVLGDSVKINNSGNLPDLLEEEIKTYNKTLDRIQKAIEAKNNASNNNAGVTDKQYPECLIKLGAKPATFQGGGIKDPNNKRFADSAMFATINGTQYLFYLDGRYQTTGFTSSGVYQCTNGVLYLDYKSVDPTKYSYQDILNNAKDKTSYQTSLQSLYYLIKGSGNFDYFAIDKLKNALPIQDNKIINGLINVNNVQKLPSFSSNGYGVIDLLVNGVSKGKKFAIPAAKTDLESGFGLRWDLFGDLSAGTFAVSDYRVEIEYNGLKRTDVYFLKLEYDYFAIIPDAAKGFFGLIDIDAKTPSTAQDFQDAIKVAIADPSTKWEIRAVKNSQYVNKKGVDPVLIEAQTTVKVKRTSAVNENKGPGPDGKDVFVKVNKELVWDLPIKLTFSDLEILTNFEIVNAADVLSPNDKQAFPKTVENPTSQPAQATQPAAQTATSQEQQNTGQSADSTQTKQSITSQSALELILQTIQVHTINKAIKQNGDSLDIGNKVYMLKMFEDTAFLKQIFSSGVMASFIETLASQNSMDISNYYTTTEEERFKINAKYGFATNLMANRETIDSFKQNNFKETLTAFALPWEVSQDIRTGTSLNHPVYIPFGLLLMILNHCCTIYDTKKDKKFQTPLIYVDFNNQHNFFLSTPKQLSVNAFEILIPFEGQQSDFKALFDPEILDGKSIRPVSGSNESVPLFNPSDDALSKSILPVKFDEIDSNAYRGKVMNILLSIDYLVKLVRDYSFKDGSNSVYLKPFLEHILSNINKSLGDFNAFRLAYVDQANCFQIVDDQFIPSSKEDQLSPTNRTELPLIGKKSIAKSLEIKTDVSSKLANMIAISSNSTIENKTTLSTNGDSVGYLNANYVDRYIVDKLEITGSQNQKSKSLDTLKIAAKHFNETIKDFLTTAEPNPSNVPDATNYYIEKLSKVKNSEYATRASALIPVSLNFSTDGVSGLSMGQGFTIPDELLPYTYSAKKVQGMPLNQILNVGFIVTGLNHSIENNSWNTTVKANMFFLKDKTLFNYTSSKADSNIDTFIRRTPSEGGDINLGSGGGDCGCTRCPPGAGPQVWNAEKQEFEREYSCADQVEAPESVNTNNFGNGRKYYGDYVFKKGVSDINLSKAGLTPLTESEIIDDTTQNRFLLGTITSNPDNRTFVVHHTAGNAGPASRTYSTFYSRGLPAQYVISGDAKIHRFMPDGAKGWHAGDYNGKSIGVEISARNNEAVSDDQVKAAVRLIHYLGFKKSQVVGHGQISEYKQPTEGKKVVDFINTRT